MPYYAFEGPLIFVDKKQTEDTYQTFMTVPYYIPNRDKNIKIGKVTADGRLAIQYFPKVRPFFANQ
jgi:hypothetical protein